ncbi:WG repeat-containing protein [Psychrobacter sp. I-STPA10]|uniref:WG repeat-containing protein n=1 Tax=Psychrobacter sp. I-STPA10 TaxID=2585769 RepID=UPI001E34FCBC|nr:WG repeat-containing protein [Psychrobacter sp. I-STPA10]
MSPQIPSKAKSYLTRTMLSLSAMLTMAVSPLVMANTDLMPYCLGGECAYFDTSGNQVIKPLNFDSVYNFTDNGLAAVSKDGQWGFIDKSGKLVIPFQYDYVGPMEYSVTKKGFSEGLAAVYKDGQWGFIDKSGKLVIPYQFKYAYSFQNGVASVSKDDKWGVIDKTGRTVVPFQFNLVYPVVNGVMSAQKNDNWGHMDSTGKEVTPIHFKVAGDFGIKGFGMVQNKADDKFALVNKSGEIVKALAFDMVKGFSRNGLARVERSGKWGFIDQSGKVVIPLQFDEEKAFLENDLASVKKDGLYYIIDEAGNKVVPFSLNEYTVYSNNFIKNDNDGTVFNRQGNKILFTKTICNTKVLTNNKDAILLPKKTEQQICKEAANRKVAEEQQQAEQRRQAEEAKKQEERNSRECDHVYVGKTFRGRHLVGGTMFSSAFETSTTFVVTGFSAKTGRVSVKNTETNKYGETYCSQVGRNPFIASY